MDLTAELARFDAPPELAQWVSDTLGKLAGENQRNLEVIRQRDLKIQALTLELSHLRRTRYGVRSEALAPEQRELFQETWNTDLAAVEAQAEQLATQGSVSIERRKRAHPGRQALPDHLPRIEYRHEPDSCTCGQCGSALVKIGEDVTEQLDVEPARFFVNRHIRSKYACRVCESVSAAPVPPALIDGGLAAVGLFVWVITGKYLDHLPLYRLEGIAARANVALTRVTLAQWVGRIGVALQPLADRLGQLLRERLILHADETPVAQLDPGAGKTKRAYLWAYRSNTLETGPPPIVVFDYQGSRSGQHAQNFLQGWEGHLMVDDFAGYKALFTRGITELGCMAHARRKFFEIQAGSPSPIAAEALARIAQLYVLEAQAKACSIEDRAALRAEQSAPRLKALREWLIQTRGSVAEGSATARAIDYSLKRWEALARYATRGDLPIDNNPVENAIRPIVVGKKNWLFTGSERAGKRAAAIQSLLATAKLNGLDPAAWLRDTLEKLPTWPNSRIDELLPLRTTVH
ncbi:MAG: IS66 family transposase [Burkholderiales bacterium]